MLFRELPQTLITLFNSHIIEFIDDLCNIIEDSGDKEIGEELIKLNEELIIDDESLDRFYATRDRINDDKYEAAVIKDLLYMMSSTKG